MPLKELAETPVDQGESAALAAAVEQNPADHQSRFDLAVALNAEGRREEALDHLESTFPEAVRHNKSIGYTA